MATQIWSIEPIVESDFYEKITDMQKEGTIVVEGERRGYITQNRPLGQRMNLIKDKEYLAVVVTDKTLNQIDLKIKNKLGEEMKKSSEGEQVLLLKISPLKKSGDYYFQLNTEELGGYYHFFLISEVGKVLSSNDRIKASLLD